MAITTITTTAAEDARLVVAFGTYLRLGRNATAAEIKQAIASWITGIVVDQEQQASIKALAAPTLISPT